MAMKNISALFFPSMHPEFVDTELPEWVNYLDPGIARSRGYNSRFFQPDNLPISEKDAQRYVDKCLSFGEQFRDPKEISYLLGSDLQDFNRETTTQIKSLLSGSGYGSHGPGKEGEDNFLNAQMALLLSWTLEEKLMEYKDLQQGVDDQWKGLLQDLGVDGEEEDAYLPGIKSISSNELRNLQRELDWVKVLPWFLVFARDLGLFVLDTQIREQWEEYGLVFEQFSSEYPGLYHSYAYGYELALEKEESEKWPWLNERYRVFFQHS